MDTFLDLLKMAYVIVLAGIGLGALGAIFSLVQKLLEESSVNWWGTLLPLLLACGGIAIVILGTLALVYAPSKKRRLGEAIFQQRAKKLLKAVREAVKHAPVSDMRKKSILKQAEEVPNNIALGLQKLKRLRKVKDVIRHSMSNSSDVYIQQREELAAMERQLIDEMNHLIEILGAIPVSLMKVELARGDTAIAKVLADLGESNKRMRDLAESWQEINQ